MYKLVHGEVCGLSWYEIPREAGGWSARNLDPSFDVITVIAPLGRLPSGHTLKLLGTKPASTNIVSMNCAFQPFDPAVELPGRAVMYAYHEFDDEAINAWAKANLDIPPELDLTFAMGRYGDAVTVSAATVKKGRLVNVRRRLTPGMVMKDALAEHLPYFLRNCRRPEGGLAEFTCHRHIQQILNALPSAGALAVVKDWLERHRRAEERGVQSLTLEAHLLPDTGVRRITLDMFTGTNAVKAHVELAGGHSVSDVDTGVEITLRGDIPDTIAGAMKGRPLSDALGIGWASDILVRTVRDPDPGARSLTMRGGVESTALRLPDRSPPTEEEAAEIIRGMAAGEHTRWTGIQAAALPVLRRMTRAHAVEVMHLLAVRNVDLTPYGQPGWILRGLGPEIVVEECPTISMDALLAGTE
jgi:hypothetical protein